MKPFSSVAAMMAALASLGTCLAAYRSSCEPICILAFYATIAFLVLGTCRPRRPPPRTPRMTETAWLACTDPDAMLEFLRSTGRASDRKLRLFGVACCRRFHAARQDPTLHIALGLAERFADGLATEKEREGAALTAAGRADIPWMDRFIPWEAERADAWSAAFHALLDAEGMPRTAAIARLAVQERAMWTIRSIDSAREAAAAEGAAQCDPLRELFRPAMVIDPPWLTPDVAKLAEAAYNASWDHDLFHVLGDALEAAGCTDPAILGHARGGGVHAKGCWLLDGLLGKG
jgi:hypothetical protein